MYHTSVVEQATNALSASDEVVTQQILQALANTSTDYVELNEKNLTALSLSNGSEQPVVPNCNLSNALYHRNSSLFENSGSLSRSSRNTHAQDGSSWRHQQFVNDSLVANNAFSTNNTYNRQLNDYSNNHQMGGSGDAPASQINCNPQGLGKDECKTENPPESNNGVSNPQFNQNDEDLGQQDVTKSLRGFRKGGPQNSSASNHATSTDSFPIDSVKNTNGALYPNKLGNDKVSHNSSASHNSIKTEISELGASDTKCNIPVSKLSKEEIAQMGNSVKSFESENPQQAEELGMTNALSRRKTRASSQSQNINSFNVDSKSNDAISNNAVGSDGVSEDEDSISKRGRNKFFKASEAQKIDDDQRKRKSDDSGDVFEKFGKRRRQKSPTPDKEELKPFVPKKITRKVERKLIPMLAKIDQEELMDTNTFVRFNKTVDLIFENMEDVNMQEFEEAERNAKDNESSELPPEILIPKYQLQDLASETAKIKSLGAMESIPNDRLVKLLNILELNIRDGSKVVPLPQAGEEDDEDEDKMWLELAMERVTRAADSSLTVLHVLTSKNMAKCVYTEDVIDRVVLFLRFQLSNTIYPSYDPVYKEISKKGSGYMGNMKKKRNYAATVRDKNIIGLYSKCRELTDLLADLVKMTLLTDTTVLHISTIGKKNISNPLEG